MASSRPRQCVWCGKWGKDVKAISLETLDRFAYHTTETHAYVHPEHEAKLRTYNARYLRYGRVSLVALLAESAAFPLGGLLPLPSWILNPALLSVLILMGITIIVFPFSTPESALVLGGLRNARRVGRVAGGLLVALGVGIAATASW